MSESKLDNTFPTNLFKINGYKIFRYDRNQFGGGLFLYVNERVPCSYFKDTLTFPTFEVYQNNRKWLFLGVYKPPNQNDIEFLNRIVTVLDYYS